MVNKKIFFAYLIFAILVNFFVPASFSQKMRDFDQIQEIDANKKHVKEKFKTMDVLISKSRRSEMDFNSTTAKSDFQVNDDGSNRDQKDPAIAVDSSRNFVVVWEDDKGATSDIVARLYDSNGAPIAASFSVDQGDQSTLTNPSVAKAKTGELIISFQKNFEQGAFANVITKRYSKNGQFIAQVPSPVLGEWGVP